MDGQGCLEFDNVVVVTNTGLLLVCLVSGQAVSVLPEEMLFGTTIWLSSTSLLKTMSPETGSFVYRPLGMSFLRALRTE